ncbi:MAG: hypothetical protein GEU88_14895 [Solirubrobacterales bacterium]|nr:hypothetical protein [Solirubrobacterales bacterium]
MFEAAHSERIQAPAAAVWELWADPGRWPDWDHRITSAELGGELRVGAELRVKLRRGGRVRYEVIELEPERLLITEVRFPGARLGHEQRLEPAGDAVASAHRLYVSGPLSGFWAPMLGRKRMRENVSRFGPRERELVEPGARPKQERNARRR